MHSRRLVLLAAPLFRAPPLHAQSWKPVPDKPNLRPIRDVVVEYQLMDADSPNETPRERTITVNWASPQTGVHSADRHYRADGHLRARRHRTSEQNVASP